LKQRQALLESNPPRDRPVATHPNPRENGDDIRQGDITPCPKPLLFIG